MKTQSKTILTTLLIIALADAWHERVQAQAFVTQGPAPSNFETASDSIRFGGSYGGAVQAVLADPTDPNKMYIGGVNGGVWVTTTAGKTWTPLSDNQLSLSIASLSFDATDPTHQKIYAGIGLTSNGMLSPNLLTTDRGGSRIGILYSANGGSAWTNLSNNLSGKSVVDVAAIGNKIFAATFEPWEVAASTSANGYGLYRSTDGGASFSFVSGVGNLPAGAASSLKADATNPNLLYTAISNGLSGGGIYVSRDGGSTWHATATSVPANQVARLATGPNGSVLAGIFTTSDSNKGQLVNLALSKDSGVTWTTLAVPPVNAGLQAATDLALAIDPRNPNIVYVAGDRTTEEPYTLPAYRVVLNPDGTSQAFSLTNEGTSNGSSAHADGRNLAFTQTGNLILVGDGGVNIRTNPTNNSGVWSSLNTETLSLREAYAVAYDAIGKRLVVAAQDNGIARQSSPGTVGYTMTPAGTGDGMNAAINDRTLASSQTSVLYSSSQNLGAGTLARTTYNAVNNSNSYFEFAFAAQSTNPGSIPFLAADYTETENGQPALPMSSKLILNRNDPTQLAFGTNYVYVATDAGASSSALTDFINLGSTSAIGLITALAYGTADNVNALLAGSNLSSVNPAPDSPVYLYYSSTREPNSLIPLTAYTTAGGLAPSSLVFDSRYQRVFYVADTKNLWSSTDTGNSFNNLTSYLTSLNIIRPTAVEFISNNGVNALLVGGLTNNAANPQNPLVTADSDSTGNILTGWRVFGTGLPNTIVNQLVYNSAVDVLAVSLFGRGVWLLYDVTAYYPSASVLRFGLADNNSSPDVSFLTGNRPLEKYGSGTLSISGLSTYTGGTTVYAGTISIAGAGPLGTGPVFIGSGGTLAGTGSIAGALTVTGSLSPGHATGLLTTQSTVTMQTGSTYIQNIGGQVQASASTSGGLKGFYSWLNVASGQFIIQPNVTLSPALPALLSLADLGAGVTPYLPALGDRYRIITAAGGISGTFSHLTQPAALTVAGSQMIQFYNTGGSNSLDLAVIPRSYATTLSASNANIRSVTHVLDQATLAYISNTPTTAQAQLIYAASGQTVSTLPSFAQALAGENYAATLAVVPQATLRIQQAVMSRLSDVLTQPGISHIPTPLTNSSISATNPGGQPTASVSSNPEVTPYAHTVTNASLQSGAAWGEIAFQYGNRPNDSQSGGWTSNLFQGLFGVDAYSEAGIKLGGGLALSSTNVRTGFGNGTVQQNALFLYGKLPVDQFVLDGMASYGLNTTDNSRTDPTGYSGGMQAKGVKGNDTLLSIGLNLPLELEDVRVTPYMRVTWQQMNQSSINEGQSLAALTVDRFSGSGMRGVLGFVLGSKSMNPMKEQYTFRANLAIGVDSPGLINPALNASLLGIPTTITTPGAGTSFLQAGLYGTTRFADNAFAYAGVSGEFRSNAVLGAVNIGVQILF